MEKMENAHSGKNCCDDGCMNSGGCPSCYHFRSYCWICKIGRFFFWLLVILALGRFAFGGPGMHRWGGYPGARRDKPGYMMVSGNTVPGEGYINGRGCMGQKRGTVKSWFWGDDVDQTSGEVVQQ